MNYNKQEFVGKLVLEDARFLFEEKLNFSINISYFEFVLYIKIIIAK